jgi:16S rRNA processing protein RimM
MTWVRLGRLGRPHGVDGELYLDDCGLDAESLAALSRVEWRGADGSTQVLTLAGVRPAHTRMLVRFAGIDNRDQASRLTHGVLMAESTQIPDAGPGAVYQFQLLGLEVQTEDGRVLGTVTDAFPTAAHWVYVVNGARELMIPVHEGTILNVDLEARRITVSLPAGLEELS